MTLAQILAAIDAQILDCKKEWDYARANGVESRGAAHRAAELEKLKRRITHTHLN